jgi:PAS domain S-box-containing protein
LNPHVPKLPNPAIEVAEELGYTIEEFYADDFNFLDLIAPEYIPLIQKNLHQHMSGSEVDPYEYVLLNRDGERIEVIITTKLIQFGSGHAILGIVTDITERKRAERSLLEKDE